MKLWAWVLGILAAICLLTVLTSSEPSYHVVGVHDGDTITVLDHHKQTMKVRLAGIDAPELKQAFGNQSKQALSERVFNQDVHLKIVTAKDKWGRTVAIIMFKGRNINLEMIQIGMAWHYKSYSKSAAFADAEKHARDHKIGLWADKHPIPPWEYRDKK